MPEPIKRYIPPPTVDKVYHFLLFGDLSLAALVHPSMIEKKDTYEFYFKPTPTMVFKYQIQDFEYNTSRACIVKEYQKNMCFRASDYPIGWVILCDFNGQLLDNDFIKRINNAILYANQELNKEILKYRILLARQSYEQIIRGKHPEEARARLYEDLEKSKKVTGTTQEIYGTQVEPSESSYEPR